MLQNVNTHQGKTSFASQFMQALPGSASGSVHAGGNACIDITGNKGHCGKGGNNADQQSQINDSSNDSCFIIGSFTQGCIPAPVEQSVQNKQEEQSHTVLLVKSIAGELIKHGNDPRDGHQDIYGYLKFQGFVHDK